MLADTAALYVDLSLRGGPQFNTAIDKARKGVRGLTLDTTKLRSGLSKVGQGVKLGLTRGLLVGGAAVAFLALQIRSGIKSLAELEQVQKATNAVLKSTKGIAGETAESIRELAEKYEDLTTIDDKVIQGAENVLLRYTKLRKKAFEPALASVLDLSVALGIGAPQAAKLLGRALNDPIKGLAALTRIGVTFTDAEKKKIKRLVETNRTLDAQRLILDKVNTMFGGRAKAAAEGYQGSQERLKDAVEELRMAFAEKMLPVLTKVSNKLAKLLKDPAIIQKVKDFGDTIAGLFTDANIDDGVQGVKNFFGFLRDLPWGVIKDGLQVSAAAAKKAVDIFRGLPPDLQKGLIGLLAVNKLTGGLVASGIGDLLKFTLGSLKTIYAGSVTVVGPSTGGVPGAVGGTGGGIVGTATTALTAASIIGLLAGAGNTIGNAVRDKLGTTTPLAQGIQQTQVGLLFGPLFGVNSPLAERLDNLIKVMDTVSDPTAPTTIPNDPASRATVQIGEEIRKQTPLLVTTADYTQRFLYLSQRLSDAESSGNERRAERMRNKIDALMSTAEGTTGAVQTNTGVLRNKDLSVNISTTNVLTISAVAVAQQVQRTVLGHKVGFM